MSRAVGARCACRADGWTVSPPADGAPERPPAAPSSLTAAIGSFEAAVGRAGLVVAARSELDWIVLVRRHRSGRTYGGAFMEAIRQPGGVPPRLTPGALETILDAFALIWARLAGLAATSPGGLPEPVDDP